MSDADFTSKIKALWEVSVKKITAAEADKIADTLRRGIDRDLASSRAGEKETFALPFLTGSSSTGKTEFIKKYAKMLFDRQKFNDGGMADLSDVWTGNATPDEDIPEPIGLKQDTPAPKTLRFKQQTGQKPIGV